MSSEDREARTQAWEERTIAQYNSYKYPHLRSLVSVYYESQERRIAFENRVRLYKRIGLVTPEDDTINQMAIKNFATIERDYTKLIEKELETIPIYKHYLSEIRGVGSILSGCLIAYIQDIGRFDTHSALWRYAGVSSIDGKAQRRAIGSHIDYNPKLKTVMYKIGMSFIKAKNPIYRKVYDEAHQKYESRGKWSKENPTGNKNKAHLMFRSLKAPERIFLANLWTKWRELEGLPVSEPYIFGPGGHSLEHKVRD